MDGHPGPAAGTERRLLALDAELLAAAAALDAAAGRQATRQQEFDTHAHADPHAGRARGPL
jgi:hypothetical protein